MNVQIKVHIDEPSWSILIN